MAYAELGIILVKGTLMISSSTMQVRKTSALATAAVTLLAALIAVAVALPSNALAKTPTFEENANNVVCHLTAGTYDNSIINEHYTKPLHVYVSGTVTIKGVLASETGLSIFAENGSTGNLTVTAGLYSGEDLVIGDMWASSKNLTVNAKEKSGEATTAAVTTAEMLWVWNANLNATGLMYGLEADDNINLYNCKVVSKATSKKIGAAGVICWGAVQAAYINSEPTKKASLEATGYSYGITGNMVKADHGTIKGTATKTTTATTSSPAMGICVSGIEATNSNIRGYATAPSKYSTYTSTSDKIGSAGISCYALESKGSTIYASNKGKYGAGIKAQYVRTQADSDGAKTKINTYAKNYGTGFASENLEMRYTDIVSYGGKYAMRLVDYGDSESFYSREDFNHCVIRAYGKNAKGTRTGHGIVADDQILFNDCDVLVYAKNSSSYYGIRSITNDIINQENGNVRVYAYSSKGYVSKTGVWRDSTSTYKLNGKTYKKAGLMA